MFWQLGPRWKKVWQDLKLNKTRSILTILSIAVGVFAVGTLNTYSHIQLPDMQADYDSVNPSSARIYTSVFDDIFLHSIREIPGVGEAEGRSTISGQVDISTHQKIPIFISSCCQNKNQLNLLKFSGPDIVLQKKEILLERSAATTGIKAGDLLAIELPDGKIKTLKFIGFVHDPTVIPYTFSATISGYVTLETIEMLGGTAQYNELIFNVRDKKTDDSYVSEVANRISDKLKKGGIEVFSIYDYSPGRYFANDIVAGIMVVANYLGWFTVLLSVFLVVNTVNALMAQQIRQIGIMKSIGGQSMQIYGMYLVLMLIFGLISFVMAAPLSAIGGYFSAGFGSMFVNYDLRPFRIIPEAIILEAGIAFLVPVLASLVPMMAGLRTSVREAISNYGVGDPKVTINPIEQVLQKIRFLPRPIILSLRNSLRRKGRLLLTLAMLTIGGAIFMAVFNLWGALEIMIQQSEGYLFADINIDFNQTYRIEKINEVIGGNPLVDRIEGWSSAFGQLLSPDKKSQMEINILAPPEKATTIFPVMISGRWLAGGDQNELVVGNNLIKKRPDLMVGQDVIFKIKGKEQVFHIVGIYQMAGSSNSPIVYAGQKTLENITRTPGQIFEVRVKTRLHDVNNQNLAALSLQNRFREEGISVAKIQTGAEWHAQQIAQSNIFVFFVMMMALIISLVGGLGLTASMGMNVMERIREIGVMRAIGASSTAIQSMVILEGILIGLASWVFSIFLSIPITYALNYGVGINMMDTPLEFVFSYQGIAAWLIGVLLISSLASLAPAWNTSRMTIREVLVYE